MQQCRHADCTSQNGIALAPQKSAQTVAEFRSQTDRAGCQPGQKVGAQFGHAAVAPRRILAKAVCQHPLQISGQFAFEPARMAAAQLRTFVGALGTVVEGLAQAPWIVIDNCPLQVEGRLADIDEGMQAA